ncbi:MAG: twin arginine-targeting protein translocase TatC [Deltaproteobacteria bacterium 13_1_40CM_4_68_19]|nr:MAG: twin arginine-targeting protein translocase TatC [Deltaproteobacteria bacterium 13_1_40CM_4_68_19]
MSPALLPKPAARTEGPEDDVQLSLRDHLIELRKRLKWAVIWLLLGFGASYYWSQQIFHFMMQPVFAALPEGEKALHFASSVEPFIIYLKVGLYAGLFVASPFIFWQIWLFVAPGLYRRERKKIAPFVLAATLFFVGGAAFCYLVILPPAFQFLINTAGPDIKPVLMMDEQLGLVMMMLLAFGIIFELPMVLTLLAMMGVVDYKFLSKYRRHAIIVNVIIAAFVTPTGDPFNLALMALPMMVCYELGVLGARIFGKKGDAARLTA